MSKETNIVYIGKKPVMSYVLAVITCFNTANTKEVTLKARGQAITTAVDTAEITRRRFMESMKVSNIQLGTEEMPVEEGGTRAVSTIEITLTR
jgi:archaea-specific DNA-binding protein